MSSRQMTLEQLIRFYMRMISEVENPEPLRIRLIELLRKKDERK